MELHTSFGRLSQVVERYERRGRSVRCAEAVSEGSSGLRATLEVPVSLCTATATEGTDARPALTPERATVTADGGLQVEFAGGVDSELPAGVDVEDRSVAVADGDVVLTLTIVIDADDEGGDVADTGGVRADERAPAVTASDENDDATPDDEPTRPALASVRDESVPPYEDTAYLRRLYEHCDTFAEMSRHIEMDVAAETVRRYMIDAGVHSPTSYGTDGTPAESGADDSTEERADGTADETADGEATAASASDAGGGAREEQLLTDGIGLPEDVRIDDVVDAVAESSTVYEVQRRLGLDGQRTWQLLQQLDVVDLLVGRLSDAPGDGVSHETVAERIRGSARHA